MIEPGQCKVLAVCCVGNLDLSSDNSGASLAVRAYRSAIRSIFDVRESHHMWLRRFLYM